MRNVTLYSPLRTTVGQLNQERSISRRVITIGLPGPSGNNPNLQQIGFNYSQPLIRNTWLIVHNLGYKPNAQAFTPGGVKIDVRIQHLDNNTTELTLNPASDGYARLA